MVAGLTGRMPDDSILPSSPFFLPDFLEDPQALNKSLPLVQSALGAFLLTQSWKRTLPSSLEPPS